MTKQQMEERIAELEAALKAEDKTDPADVRKSVETEAIAEMQGKLSAALKQNEKLVAQADKASARSSDLDVELKKLAGDYAELQKTFASHEALRDELQAKVTLLTYSAAKLSAECDRLTASGLMSDDHAVLGGQSFRIIHRTTAKWVKLEVDRRHVPEDATTLVLERTGD